MARHATFAPVTSAAPTLEQLRVLAAVADAGSFSSAAVRLGRSQPVVSYMVANLESQLGFALFERGKRRPILTERGGAILAHARRICLLSDELAASAENLRRGLESELSLAIDLFFPPARLAGVLRELSVVHPSVVITLRNEPLGGVLDLVLKQQCQLGISMLTIDWPDLIEPREFGSVDFIPVVAAGHPLAAYTEAPPTSLVREYVQLVLRDPGSLTQDVDYAVSGVRIWRVTDPAVKLALLREGIGWGYMPAHLIADDLAQGRLVTVRLPVRPGGSVPYTLLHRVDSPPGPVARWLIERLVAWQ